MFPTWITIAFFRLGKHTMEGSQLDMLFPLHQRSNTGSHILLTYGELFNFAHPTAQEEQYSM